LPSDDGRSDTIACVPMRAKLNLYDSRPHQKFGKLCTGFKDSYRQRLGRLGYSVYSLATADYPVAEESMGDDLAHTTDSQFAVCVGA
jgi:hypothetical protein